MGQEYRAICVACGREFMVRDGGAFSFHLLHSDVCGTERGIGFDEIGEPHLRHLKGLKVPYCMASAEHDPHVRETYPGEPMGEEEYHTTVEGICGKCDCGGQFRFDAFPRCPKCRTPYEKTGGEKPDVLYD